MKKKLMLHFSAIVLCAFPIMVCGQNKKADSLIAVVQKQRNDTSRLTTLNALTKCLVETGEYQKAGQWIDTTLQLAGRLAEQGVDQESDSRQMFIETIRKAQANALNHRGVIRTDHSEFDAAKLDFNQAMSYATAADYKLGQAQIWCNRGALNEAQGKFKEALDCYRQSSLLYHEAGNNEGEAITLVSNGNVYCLQGLFAQAIDYYNRALDIYRRNKIIGGVALVYSNMGNVYNSQQVNDQALLYYQKALSLADSLGKKKLKRNTLANIGTVYDNMKNYTKALSYYFQALKLSLQMNDLAGVSIYYGNIANTYQHQGDSALADGNKQYAFNHLYPLAKMYYQRGLDTALKYNSYEGILNNMGNLGTLCRGMGDTARAKQLYERTLFLADSLGAEYWQRLYTLELSRTFAQMKQWEPAYKNLYRSYALQQHLENIDSIQMQTRLTLEYDYKLKLEEQEFLQKKTETAYHIMRNVIITVSLTLFFIVIIRLRKSRSLKNGIILSEKYLSEAKQLEEVLKREAGSKFTTGNVSVDNTTLVNDAERTFKNLIKEKNEMLAKYVAEGDYILARRIVIQLRKDLWKARTHIKGVGAKHAVLIIDSLRKILYGLQNFYQQKRRVVDPKKITHFIFLCIISLVTICFVSWITLQSSWDNGDQIATYLAFALPAIEYLILELLPALRKK